MKILLVWPNLLSKACHVHSYLENSMKSCASKYLKNLWLVAFWHAYELKIEPRIDLHS